MAELDAQALEDLKTVFRALAPYLDQLVVVGGWAAWLYRYLPGTRPGPTPLLTQDVDIALDPPYAQVAEPIAERMAAHGLIVRYAGGGRVPVTDAPGHAAAAVQMAPRSSQGCSLVKLCRPEAGARSDGPREPHDATLLTRPSIQTATNRSRRRMATALRTRRADRPSLAVLTGPRAQRSIQSPAATSARRTSRRRRRPIRAIRHPSPPRPRNTQGTRDQDPHRPGPPLGTKLCRRTSLSH